jgi:hypothetical protein
MSAYWRLILFSEVFSIADERLNGMANRSVSFQYICVVSVINSAVGESSVGVFQRFPAVMVLFESEVQSDVFVSFAVKRATEGRRFAKSFLEQFAFS